jgi:hypothetical protein
MRTLARLLRSIMILVGDLALGFVLVTLYLRAVGG